MRRWRLQTYGGIASRKWHIRHLVCGLRADYSAFTSKFFRRDPQEAHPPGPIRSTESSPVPASIQSNRAFAPMRLLNGEGRRFSPPKSVVRERKHTDVRIESFGSKHFQRDPLAAPHECVCGFASQCQLSSPVARTGALNDRCPGASEPGQKVQDATRKYFNVNDARKAGYGPFLGCVTGPDHGAMGIHYVNGKLFGGLRLTNRRR